jgi:hypothetical protein
MPSLTPQAATFSVGFRGKGFLVFGVGAQRFGLQGLGVLGSGFSAQNIGSKVSELGSRI